MKNENKSPLTQQQLEQLLHALQNSLPPAPNFTQQTMTRIQATHISPAQEKDNRLWRWYMKGSLGIAACLAIGLTAWHFGLDSPRIAYGIDDLPQKMLQLKSLHLKIQVYSLGADDQTSNTMELFIQRPNRLRIMGAPNTENGIVLSTSDTLVTPDERIVINAENKHADVSPETSVDAQLETEQAFQTQIALLFGSRRDFKKIGEKNVANISTDVYESTLKMPGESSRLDVFLNPATALPVRAEIYVARSKKPEQLAMVYDTIEPNPPIPADTFHIDIPRDFQIEKSPAMIGDVSELDDVKFLLRDVLALDDKRVIACWAAYNINDPQNDLDLLTGNNQLLVRGNQNAVYKEHLLHADPAPEGFHWRWSLFTTDQPAKTWANALSFSLHMSGKTCNNDLLPIQLPPDQLAPLLEAAQRLTLPQDTPNAKVLTLKEIEAQK